LSGAQVLADERVNTSMQAELAGNPIDEVRCLSCHAVYELPLDTRARDTPACPVCGAVAWLAATIPVVESEALADA
jgi:NAD-dependent SIR2 family protein deacetylase